MTRDQLLFIQEALLDTLQEVDAAPIDELVSQALVDKVTEAAEIVNEELLNGY